MKDFVKSGGEIVQGKKSKGPRKPGLSLASKHIGGSGDKMRPSRTGRGSNPMGKAVVAVENNIDIPEIPREPRRREEQKPNPKMNEYMDTDQGATPPKTPIEKPMDTKPAEEPKDKKDPKTYMDKAKSVTKESSILKGMSEAHISEEELLLSPGQGVRFKTELMPKRNDHEVEMARNQLRVAAQSAKRIYQNIKDLSEIQGLDGWVQAKITKASDYLDAVNNYIEGKKQMLEIQDEVDEQVQYTPKGVPLRKAAPAPINVPAGFQAVTQPDGSTRISKIGSIPRDQYEKNMAAYKAQNWTPEKIADYSQRMASGQGYTDAERQANIQQQQQYFGKYADDTNLATQPQDVPIQEMDIEEAHKLSAHEKFKRGVKRAGYDMDAGANRLLNLIARQAEERKEREKEFAKRDAEFYGKRKDIDEGGLNEYAPNGGDDNYDRKIYFAVQEPDEHYSTYALNPNTIDTDELKVRFGKKLWAKGPFMDLNDAHEAIWAHIEKNKDVTEDWQKTNRRDKTSGMSRKAVKQYRRENPGSKLQTAVTTKPSKLKKGSKSAKRRKSFCSRMRGMKKSRTSAKTARDPNSNINKALRRWNCESVEEMRNLVLLAEQKIAMMREEESLEENLHKWFKEKWVRFGPDGKIRGDCARGDDSEGKPKCLPQSKAHALGKKGRASAGARKRREDPNPERSGKAINVATKKKTNEEQIDELKCWPGFHRVKGTKAGAPGSCAKNEDVAEGSVTPNVSVNKIYDDGNIKEWHIYRGEEMIGFVVKNLPDTAEGLYIASGYGPGRGFTEEFNGLKSAVKYITSLDNQDVAEGLPQTLRKVVPGYAKREIDKKMDAGKFGKTDADKDANFQRYKKIQDKLKEQGVAEGHEMCPECGGAMYSEEMINEKKDACYYKVKSRYKVWPSAYASGALVKCRKKGAKNWGTKSESIDTKSNILKGMAEAKLREEELLLAPGQGIKFKTELMPKRTDHEVEMARNQLRSSFENAKDIYQSIKDLSEIQGLDGWVQAKITKASDYLEAVNQYLEGKKDMLEIQSEVDHQVEEQYPAQQYSPRGVPLKQAPAAPVNVPQGWQASTQADGSTRISKQGSMPRAQYQQNMANYKAQNWTPQNIADYDRRMTSGQGYSDAEKYANYQAGVKATGREDPETLAMLIPDENVRNQLQQQTQQPIDQNLKETERLSAREKFKRGLKRAGYDPDAGADRLLKLIARQAEERAERERKWKEEDEEFYKNRKLKEQDPQPVDNKQQEQPKSNKLFDVLKSIGDVALPVGRAVYGMQNRDIPADVKGEIKTRLHNYVTGEPNK
jgi:hypothetical protein